jgi:uncharacterized membrane protein
MRKLKPQSQGFLSIGIGLALLVVSANLNSHRWWLVLPGWILVGLPLISRIVNTPDQNPYKAALILTVFPVFLFGYFIRNIFRLVFEMLFSPDAEHLSRLISSRSFWVVWVFYLGLACVTIGNELKDSEEKLARYYQQQQCETSSAEPLSPSSDNKSKVM